jgi:Ca2+-binding RTX toxin-like protein
MANYTTLGNINLFACYLGTIKKYEDSYRNKPTASKVAFFQQAANSLTTSIGIPPIKITNSIIYEDRSKPTDPLIPAPYTIGTFDSVSGNIIRLNDLRIVNQDIKEFRKLAVTFYHELRHAEQLFRGLQYYRQVLKQTSIVDVGKNIDVFAKDVSKYPLPPDRTNFGAVMYREYITSLVEKQYEKSTVERDSFLFSREGYKILGYSQSEATAWYNLAFENIDTDVVRANVAGKGPVGSITSQTPLGLVDSTTSYYSSRVKLTKVGSNIGIMIDGVPKMFQPIPISELNSISGSSISNNNDTLNGDVIIVAGVIVPSPFKDDLIQGFGGNDVIDGKEGNDFLYGNEGADSIKGGNGNDRLFGGAGNDFLEGGSGNDILDGETGNDTMSGGLGDDIYYIDSIGDIIQGEIITGGKDLVYSSISLNLGAFLEDLMLIGDGNITGAGNGLNNLLVGNNKVNILNGLAGDDILYGLNGNDILKGGDGNDYLNGDGKFGIADGDGIDGNSTFVVPRPVVLGSDLMEGGKGNDTYVVNIISDVVVENVAEGIDTVISSISYNLGANLENLTLVGSGNITGAGNTLDNVLTGNDKVNLLNGWERHHLWGRW